MEINKGIVAACWYVQFIFFNATNEFVFGMFFLKMIIEPTLPCRISYKTAESTDVPGKPIKIICPILMSRLSIDCPLANDDVSRMEKSILIAFCLLVFLINRVQYFLHVFSYG